jgi:hypothetical protein
MPRVGMQPVTGHSIFYRGLVSLAPPFWSKPRIAAWWQSLANELAELETAAWQVIEARSLANADTERLDVLGRLLGQPRFSTDNEVYRAVLRAKIAANRSRGLEDDVRRVIRLGAQTTVPSTITHHNPATLKIILNQTITDAAFAALAFLLPRTRAAGVGLHILRPIDSSYFIFGSVNDPSLGGDVGSAVSGTGATLVSARQF